MNSIKYFLCSLYYRSLFTLKLNKIIRTCKDKVTESFDLPHSMDSYWFECNKGYDCPPQIVEDHMEFCSPSNKQMKIIMKDWHYIPSSAEKDILGLIKYIAWLRKVQFNKKKHIISKNDVNDHIYEM